jgi:hypothetical protein
MGNSMSLRQASIYAAASLGWVVALLLLIGPVWLLTISGSIVLAAICGRYMRDQSPAQDTIPVPLPKPMQTVPVNEHSLEMLRRALEQEQDVPALKD